MKNLNLLTLAGMAFFVAQSSFAVFTPGWERPIYQARIDIVKASGSLINIKNAELTMTKQDGKKSATGFILMIDNKPVFLEVTEFKKIAENVVEYVAIPLSDVKALGNGIKLVVREAGNKWKTALYYSVPSVEPKASLELEGAKEAIYTVQ